MSIYPTSADMNAKSNRLGPNNGSTDNAGPVPMTFRNAHEEKNSRESLVDKARNKAREYDVGERNKGYLGKDEHTAWAKSMFPSMEQPEIDQHYNDHARDGTGRININKLDISSIEHHYLPDKEVARDYDLDNDGHLNNGEFQSLMKDNTTLSDKEIDYLRKSNDSNNSGEIGIDDEYGAVANSSDSQVDNPSGESLLDKARSKAREYDVGERNKGYLGKEEHTKWAESMFPSMEQAEIDKHYNDHARDGTGRINIEKLDISSIEHHYEP